MSMIPIGEAIGKLIVCPCKHCGGKPARVTAGRVRVYRTPDGQQRPLPSSWVMAECWIGKKMYRKDTLVEVIGDAPPAPPPGGMTIDEIMHAQSSVTVTPPEVDRGRRNR